MIEILLQSAIRLAAMKEGEDSNQQSETDKAVACLAHKSAPTLAFLLMCRTEKEANSMALPLISSKIGVTTDLGL